MSIIKLVIFLSQTLEACAVCFGKTDNSTAKAFTWGIAAMLGPTFAILSILAYAVIKIEKSHRFTSQNLNPNAISKKP